MNIEKGIIDMNIRPKIFSSSLFMRKICKWSGRVFGKVDQKSKILYAILAEM